jgi:RHS repeat-associated protein
MQLSRRRANMSRTVLILSLLVLFPFMVFGVEQSVYDGTELAQLRGNWAEGWSTAGKQEGGNPYFLEVSNITSSSAVITWLTEDPVAGVVEYGTTQELGEIARDGTGFWGSRIHSVRLEGLNPGERYYYHIKTGSVWLELRSFVTAEAGTGVPAIVYGLVPDGVGGGKAIVKLRVKDGKRSSSYLSCVFGLEGLWHLNLGNLRDRRGHVFEYREGMEVDVVVEGLGDDGKPTVVHKYDMSWSGSSDLSKDKGAVESRLTSWASIKSSVLRGMDEYAVEPAVRSKTPERMYLERLLDKTPEYRQARKDRLNNRRLPVRPGWSGSNQKGEASAESRRPERRNILRLRGDVLLREYLEFREENAAVSTHFPDIGRHLGIEVGVREVSLPLARGWNIFGLPVRPEEPVSAHSILEELESSSCVIAWDEERQCFGRSVFRVGDQVMGKDFLLEEGMGYFVQMSSVGEVIFEGRSILDPRKVGEDYIPVKQFSSGVVIDSPIEITPEYWGGMDPPYDYTPPSLTITYPDSGSEIYTKESVIEIIYGDNQSGLNLDSLRIVVNGDTLTDEFTVDSEAAIWYMESPDTLDEGENTIVAYIEDLGGNGRTVTSIFDVVTVPPPVEQHFVNGYVYEDKDSVFTPLEGVAVAVEGIEGVIYTDSNGHYVFPTPGLGEYRMDFTKYWYTYAQRYLVIEDGHGDVFVDDVYLVERDTVVVRITEDGGLTINSDTTVYAVFPAGAVEEDIDVSSNNIVRDIDLPWELPDGCVFVTCAKFWPDVVDFDSTVTVWQDNWREFDPGIDIPLGHYNPEEMIWEDEGMIEIIDGDWQQFRAWHFMSWFVGSLPVIPPADPIAEPAVIEDESGSPRSDYEGDFSSGSPSLGDVKLKFGGSVVRHELPSVSSFGEDRSLSFTYASHTVKPKAVISTTTEGIDVDTLPPYSGTRVDIMGKRFEAISESSGDTTVQRVRFDGKGEDGEYLDSGHYYYENRVLNYEYAEYALADSFGGPPTGPTGICTDFPTGFWATVTGDVMIDNRLGSEFGNGWALDGLQRLYFRPDGDAVITGGGEPSEFYDLSPVPVIDLAVTNYDKDKVSILLGDGNGGFEDRQDYVVGDGPRVIVSGDFDGDLDYDLAVTIEFADSVGILINDGVGGFDSTITIDVGDGPWGIVTGDFDGDSDLDLAVTISYEDSVRILINDGVGVFSSIASYSVGSYPSGIVTADFDNDSDLDLAVTNSTWDNVSILVNDGGGEFDSTTTYDVGNYPIGGIVAGDFNGDLYLDLAVTNYDDNNVSILLNDGEGLFVSDTTYLVGGDPYYIVTGDFDDDTDLDLAVTNCATNMVNVLLGDGGGKFGAISNYPVGDYPIGIIGGDLDGDMDFDLVVANRNDTTISILPGDGVGEFGNHEEWSVDSTAIGITTGNFNDDFYTRPFEFSDDFDDNTKDFDKWTRVFTSGNWYETNQRTEFQLYESGGPERYEGIQSSEFTAVLSSDVGMTFTWDMIEDIGSTGWVGFIWFEVTDGVNWIRAHYSRGHNATRYQDSNDGGLNDLGDGDGGGTWDNEIRLFEDRYYIRMASDNTGWIYDTIFSDNPTLTVKMYVQLGGGTPSYYIRSGFDNVLVSGMCSDIFQSQDGDNSNLIINYDVVSYTRIYPDSSKVVFDSDGFQVESIDRVGNTTTCEYDSLDRLITITEPGSLVTNLTYGIDGYLDTITDPAGRLTHFVHDLDSNLISITDPDSSEWQYGYDEDHILTKVMNPRGDSTLYTYDDWGYVTHVTGPDDSTNYFKASDSYQTLNEELQQGQGTRDNPADVFFPQQLLNGFTNTLWDTTFSLTNAYGKWTEKTDPLGRIHLREYDDNGYLRRQNRPDSTSISYIHNSFGNLLSMTEDSIDATLSIAYDHVFHLPIELEDAEGNLTVIERDSLGNPVQVINALSDTTFNSYNSQGLLTMTISQLRDTTEYEYNDLGRLTKIIDPLDKFTQFEHDTAGNIEAVIDAKGYRTEYVYDEMNRLTLVTDELGGETEYDYDEAGNRVLLISADGESTHFAYDQYNRLTSVTNPLDHVERYIYNTEGLMTGFANANYDTVKYVYDDAQRLTRKVVGIDTTYYQYDRADNMTRVKDPDSRILYGYDKGQRLIQEETGDVSDTAIVQPPVVLDYTRDLNGNITRRIDSENDTIWYDYDELNRIVRIRTSNDTTTYAYDDKERLDAVTRSNGTVSDYTFDAADRLLDLTHVKAGDSIAVFHYGYDDVGNRTSLTDLDSLHTFSYDSLYQLVGATHPQGFNPGEAYTYDALGNRDSSHISTSYSYDDANRLLGDDDYDYAWDNANRQVWRREKASGDTTHFVYTDDAQLIRVYDDSLEVLFAYDGEGRRIQKTVISNSGADTSVVKLTYDGEDLLFEFDAGDTLRVRYLYGPGTDNVLEAADTSGTYLYFSDAIGSMAKMTDVAGVVEKALICDSFGNVVSDTLNAPGDRIRFTGREWDDEIGLYYYRARYYDPVIGRYLSVNPEGIDGGNVNLFRYVRNNPVNLIDPMGDGSPDLYGSFDLAREVGLSSKQGLLCWGRKNLEGPYREVWLGVINTK